MKIHKGDQVQMITGNEKGKLGKVLSVSPELHKIVVEGISVRKKHMKARRQGQKGELVSVPAAFPVSRALLYCNACQRGVRVGYQIDEKGSKKRSCKRCGAGI